MDPYNGYVQESAETSFWGKYFKQNLLCTDVCLSSSGIGTASKANVYGRRRSRTSYNHGVLWNQTGGQGESSHFHASEE